MGADGEINGGNGQLVGTGGYRAAAGRKPSVAKLTLKEALEATPDAATKAWQYLVKLIDDTEAPARLRFEAAVAVTARVWGKPVARVELDHGTDDHAASRAQLQAALKDPEGRDLLARLAELQARLPGEAAADR